MGGKPHSKNQKQEISKQNNGLCAALLEAGSLRRGCVGRRARWEKGQLPGRAHRGEQVPAQQGMRSRSSAMLSPQSLSSGPRPEVGAQPYGTCSALAQDRQAGVVTEPQSHGPTEPPESPAALPCPGVSASPSSEQTRKFSVLTTPWDTLEKKCCSFGRQGFVK